MTVWIVTPVYHDVPSFRVLRENLLREVAASELAAPATVQFVVVDDTGGQDAEIEELQIAEDVMVIEPPFNLGHQRALVYALRKLLPLVEDTDTIVTMDADGEDQPRDLPRLLAATGPSNIALALRTRRRESFLFKAMYRIFRLLFQILTGTTVRSGNFASIPGGVARRIMLHPVFDLSYSAAILALDVPITYVPCERGERYAGRSRMTMGRLVMHGLGMLMPFTDRIALRSLAVFVVTLVLGVLLAAAVVFIKLFTDSAIPGWASFTALGALVMSLVALGNAVSLFVLFSQTRAVSLASVEELAVRDSAELRAVK